MNEALRRLFNVPEQASSFARELDTLHFVVILTSIAGAFGVATAIAVFSSRPGGSKAGAARGTRPNTHGAFVFEVAAIAGLLAFFLGVWITGFRQYVHQSTPPIGSLDVYVIGKQWMWTFAYPNGTATNHDLYVPVHRPVRLLMLSRDVIHSFFVPSFRVKQDVVPGRITVAWFEAVREGVYDIFCTEYCGLSHSTMRGRVFALSPAAYEDMRGRQQSSSDGLGTKPLVSSAREPAPRASLAKYGEQVAARRGCLRCHTLDGTPHLGPTWAGLYGSRTPLAGGGFALADDAYLTESMMDPGARVHLGFEPLMPSYFGLLSAVETASLVELIHTVKDQIADTSEPLALPVPPRPKPVDPLPRAERAEPLSGRVPNALPAGFMEVSP